MSYGNNSDAFLRQLSSGAGGRGAGWDYSSSYYAKCSAQGRGGSGRWRSSSAAGGGGGWKSVDDGDAAAAAKKKRVMVVIDRTARAKQAMMWALTHVAGKGDLLTILHVVGGGGDAGEAPQLAVDLGTLCKACRPEVEVEALVIQGPRLGTVLSQVRKLEASVLVLAQPKQSPFSCFLRSSEDGFVEDCINKADCLTVAVRKQSKGVGGYLVSTRWQKNFWLLA